MQFKNQDLQCAVSPYHHITGVTTVFVNYIVLMSNDYLPGIYRIQFDVV